MEFDETDLFIHGGNLDAAKRIFNPEDRWVDLSTGVSPFPYPVPNLSQQNWQGLPDTDAVEQLRQSAAAFFGICSLENLAEAPGTQAILQVLPRIFPFTQVSVVSPTYSEHARCWENAGAQVSEIRSLNTVSENAEVVVVVNPNNPDGRAHEPSQLIATAAMMAERGGLLIVDEAFCDGLPDRSVASHSGVPGLLILRSFGKFFGLAGMRLGFTLGCVSDIALIRQQIGPWAVSGPALQIGASAYADTNWISENLLRHENAATRLHSLLVSHGYDVVGSTNLFVLLERPDAKHLWRHLATHGIWTRLFAYNWNWMRLGLPGTEEDWQQLEEALDRWDG